MRELCDASEVLLKLDAKLQCSRIELKFLFDNARRRDKNIGVFYVDELECGVDEKMTENFRRRSEREPR